MFNMVAVGNVVKDATIRDVGSSKVASFVIGCRTNKKGSDGNYLTEFVNCSMWGKRGENMAPYIKKGMSVTVTGPLEIRMYDKDGEKRASANIEVQDINLNSKPAGGNATAAPAPAPVVDDTLPF